MYVMKSDIYNKGFKNWLVRFGLFWFVIVYTCMKVYSIIQNGLLHELKPVLLIKEILLWLAGTYILSWIIWKKVIQPKNNQG